MKQLRVHALTHSLFPSATLKTAIQRLGFVQADPIRSPARAQDLILRHRVKDYHAGDLDRRYEALDIEEDVLYAYGFMPRTTWSLIHPRRTSGLSALEKKVLALVRRFGGMHPRDLESHLGSERVINAWGGYSKATTRALEDLHYRGLLRIARRENGIRIYELSDPPDASLSPAERLRKLILVMANVLAPISRQTLQSNTARYRWLGNPRTEIDRMLRSGELESEQADGVIYVWPATRKRERETPEVVRFLAPFDPVVWDRRRFEHFWGWPYRFEAYTPVAKRVRGYYAMPMLWRDAIIGWANASLDSEKLAVNFGFVNRRPRDYRFGIELEAEIARLLVCVTEESAGLARAHRVSR